jgi:hypothetical protein
MERSPEAARVAEKIRTVMKHQGLSGAELADRIERLTGERHSYMWMTRRMLGHIHLTEPETVVVRHHPNRELELIAQALDMDPETGKPTGAITAEELAAAANDTQSTRSPL